MARSPSEPWSRSCFPLEAINNPIHVVCRRTTNLDYLSETLERAGVARTVGLLSLYQTFLASVPRALALSACCPNLTHLNLVSVPLRALTLDSLRSVRFDSLREFDVYYGATAATLGLLARMPWLKRLGIRGEADDDEGDNDLAFPAMPFVLDSLLWAGGTSAAACAHILTQCGGALRTLELYVFESPAALELILSAVPMASLRTFSLSAGAHTRRAQRAPYVHVTAGFLQRCLCVRDLTLQLLPGMSLADMMVDLSAQTRLRALCLRDPDLKDASWLAYEVAGGSPALATLRAIELEHDAEEEDDEVRELRAEAAAVLRPVCDARYIRLSA